MSRSDYIPLVNLLGVYFQIRDDYMNLQSTEVCPHQLLTNSTVIFSLQYAHNKGFAEDLTEGKFSFPIVHGVRANPSNRQVLSKSPPNICTRLWSLFTSCLDVLQKRPTTPTLKKHVISYLANSTDSFTYTLSVMDTFRNKVISEIERLGGNPRLDAIVELLSRGIPR